MRHRILFAVVTTAWLLTCTAPAASAQTADDLFDPNTLQELRLFLNSRDLQQLRATFQENTYYPADLHWRDVRARNVGVRSRGGGSRNATKLGLRIDFNRYTAGQRFLGLSSIVLDNLWQDPALIRERTTMALFARMGQPASRESFCRLFINNVYQGVYAIVESVDQSYLSRTLGENQGYLFEFEYAFAFYGQYLGDSLDAYKPLFDPQTRELEADSALYGPIRDLFREVNTADEVMWRESVGRYLDLDQLVTHVAIEMFVSELDGVLGYAGMNNFYFYRAGGTSRHRFIVWDKDTAFYQIDSPIFLRVDENEIVRRALAYDDLRALYLQVLEQTARSAADGDWLENEIINAAALIDQAVREDTLKQYSTEEYDAGIQFLLEFARRRSGFVIQQVTEALGNPR
jgi:spore coat protein H